MPNRIYRKKYIVLFLSLIFCLAFTQSEGGLLIESVDLIKFPQVEVRLSTWSQDGLPLSDLSRNDFSIVEGQGQAFLPDELQIDRDAPLAVAMAIDVSGSMLGQPLTDARVAAARFLDRLSPGDQVALIAFSDGVDPDPNSLKADRELIFTSNLEPVYDLVEGLAAQGGTHLYNAVLKAVAMSETLPSGHRAILVLSDGVNEPADVGDPEAAINLAKENGIPIYVIGLGNKIDEPYLRRLASETGGLFRLAPRSSELAQTFDDMASLLKTQYTLIYTSRVVNGAESLELAITLKVGGSEVTDSISLNNVPVLPTATPKPTLTATNILPTESAVPIKTVEPAIEPEPPQGLWSFIQEIPFYGWLLLAVVLVAGGFIVIRIRRRSKLMIEKCAKCGYLISDGTSECPQCGETRRIKVKSKHD